MTLIERIAAKFSSAKVTISTAESCTGGLLSASFTDLAGSSSWYTGSVIAYANSVKENILLVEKELLDEKGAVSEEVAFAMVEGVASLLQTDYAIATTGIAGPAGGSEEKPVGTVFIAWKTLDGTFVKKYKFVGDREEIRMQTVAAALLGLAEFVSC